MSRRFGSIWALVLSLFAISYLILWCLDEGQTLMGIPITILYPIFLCILLSFIFLMLSRTKWLNEVERR